MNKHRLGVSHRRGGLFYRLYFITVCHLHGGMLIASCDYLHIWKSTSICHVPPISHESVPPSPSRTTAVYSQGDRQHQSLATPCTLHPAVWHMWTSHEHTRAHGKHLTSHLATSHPLHHRTSQVYNTGPLDGSARLSIVCGGIHKRWHLCQLRENLPFPISQKGIMRLITYIVI